MTASRGNVLVTGGAGFIGSHTCKALHAAGWTPVTIDSLVTGHRDSVKWGPFHQIDVRDEASVTQVLMQHDVSAVLHFAASAYVGESVRQPDAYYDNNVGGILSLLRACAKARVRSFVFSSSCATYGIPDVVPISEDTPQRPINPYGRTKLIGEYMLADIAQQHGIGTAILRYFNAAGADPSGELAERHHPETHLIPLALEAAFGGRRLKVFGTDYETDDGTCVRDYIHVSDLAQGHVAALGYLSDRQDSSQLPSVSINLGSGTGHSIRQIIHAIASYTGRAVPHDFAPRRPGDPGKLIADPSRAGDILGFECRHSDLETIVRTAAAQFQARKADVA